MKKAAALVLSVFFFSSVLYAQTQQLPSEEELQRMLKILNDTAAQYNAALQGIADAAEDLTEQNELWERLVAAIEADDVAGIKKAETDGADIFRKTEMEGATALMIAAGRGSLAALKYLQGRGLPLDDRTMTNETALVWAVIIEKNERTAGFAKKRQRKAAVIRYLLSAGLDPNEVIVPGAGTRIIHYAAIQGFPEAIPALKNGGADMNDTNALEITALHYAAEKGDIEIVRALVEAGADVNREASGLCPLDYAEKADTPETAAYLRTKKAKRGSLGEEIHRLAQ